MNCLILYNQRPYKLSNALTEFVDSINNYSCNNIWTLNTEYGFIPGLKKIKWDVVLLDRSLFSHDVFAINKFYEGYIKNLEVLKVALFQDEHCNNEQRFKFINDVGVDIVYTCLDEKYHDIYYKNTTAKEIKTHIPGYVSDSLIEKAKIYALKNINKDIDIFYRGRISPIEWGKGAREKSNIGLAIKEILTKYNCICDIEVTENKRLYGEDWYKHLARSKFCLGVESGVSIYDIDGNVKKKVDRLKRLNPGVTDKEILDAISSYENNIYYRTISPRHFEAAAFRVCQILFNGNYSDIMKEDIHYIPLEKDFKNINAVLDKMNDSDYVNKITNNAYNDLISSGKSHYKGFVSNLDHLINSHADLTCTRSMAVADINNLMKKRYFIRNIKKNILWFLFNVFPGKSFLMKHIKPIWIYIKKRNG